MSTEYNFPNQRIQSRYFSLHSIKLFKEKLPENMVRSSFPLFHNNIVSINHNLENVELLLDNLISALMLLVSQKQKLQILMRATPSKHSRLCFWACAITTGLWRHWPLCWSISKLQCSWKNFKWGIPSPLGWNLFCQP